jgi:hypothetical protein
MRQPGSGLKVYVIVASFFLPYSLITCSYGSYIDCNTNRFMG